MNGKIFDEVLGKARPAKQEFSEVDETIKRINALLKKNKILAECVAAGSYAKGTILKDDFDVDLFVRFDYSYKEKGEEDEISALLAKAIAPLKPTLVHGSRDYFQLRKKKILFEIIPVLRIDDYKKAVNVTDMSPLHVFYVKKHYDKNPSLRDEVRLAKQFCKAARVYGAESYIRGFSGHVLDLLIINYGGFEKLLMQAAVWGERVIIDIEHHLEDPMKELNSAKTESPLIVVDPIQPDRNAAAAISKETFEEFKKKAREFLKKPGKEFFEIKKLDLKVARKKHKGEWLLILSAVPTDDSEDIAGTKLLKCHEKIIDELKNYDFKLLEADWEFTPKKSTLYYALKKEKLSATVIWNGPPVKVKPNAEMFRKKHKKVFEKDGRLFAEEKRKYMTPKELAKDLLASSYVKERVKKISISKEI